MYEDVKAFKFECVGHVQKRMRSRLRALKKRSVKTHLADGKLIWERERLTDNVIDTMQVYYGKAIRNNTHSVKAMQDAVRAIWYHMRYTDQNPGLVRITGVVFKEMLQRKQEHELNFIMYFTL